MLPWRVRSFCNDLYRSVATLGIQAQSGLANYRHGDNCADRAAHGSLVSILIPTLARGRHAGRLATLQTLLAQHLPAQTYQDYEAIVYCDGQNREVERMIAELDDSRIRVYSTADAAESAWGHPQTRLGIDVALGEYFVRINDDNRPYPEYLRTLVEGFSGDTGISYGRVVFKGDARKAYSDLLRGSYVIPRDRHAVLENGNIDCLCYMVRMGLARRYRDFWGDMYAADWRFLEAMLADGVRANFVNRLIADKH
jgi:glycosyltransferase involved in cell wall biosynthesis